MAGRHLLRRPAAVDGADYAFDPRQAKAFCDGVAHRAAGDELTNPISDNPFDQGQEAENWRAWITGWEHANLAAPGDVDGLNCAVFGAVAESPPP